MITLFGDFDTQAVKKSRVMKDATPFNPAVAQCKQWAHTAFSASPGFLVFSDKTHPSIVLQPPPAVTANRTVHQTAVRWEWVDFGAVDVFLSDVVESKKKKGGESRSSYHIIISKWVSQLKYACYGIFGGGGLITSCRQIVPPPRQLRYKQTCSPTPPPPPSRQPENRIKYPVILCCLHRNTQTSL